MTQATGCAVCGKPLDAPALRHRGVCLATDEAHVAAMNRYDQYHRCEVHSMGGRKKR